MDKELHIWMGDYNTFSTIYFNVYTNFQDTQKALANKVTTIHTTQPHFCNTKYISDYKIYVHMLDNECVQIVLGTENKNSNKDIRIAHNLEKLLLANEFGYAVENI